MGSRRLAKLLLIFDGKIVMIAGVRTWHKKFAAMPMRRTTTIKARRDVMIQIIVESIKKVVKRVTRGRDNTYRERVNR